MTVINGLIVESEEHKKKNYPREDAFLFNADKKILAIADGVTRESYVSGKESPAKIAADLFCNNFVYYWDSLKVKEKNVLDAFEYANKSIHVWNNKEIPNPDYTTVDLAGCVASGAVIINDICFWGFICDCGIVLVNKDGEILFKTKDEGPTVHEKYIWKDKKLQGLTWRDAESRKIIRTQFRNNPSEEHSFGVLTGENLAMKYVRTAKTLLMKGDVVIVYTDGLEPLFSQKKFSELIKNRNFGGLKQLSQEIVQSEGSLVYYLHE